MKKITLIVILLSLNFSFGQDCNIDDRVPYGRKAVGRIIGPGGSGTGFILRNGKLVTARHVLDDLFSRATGAYSVYIEFNVPLSDSDGTIQHPDGKDVYTILSSYKKGDDWAVFEVAPNTTTNMMPLEAQDDYLDIKQDDPVITQVDVLGYGKNDNIKTWEQVLQISGGSFTGYSSDMKKIFFTNFVYKDVSGGPIIDKYDGKVVGIATDATCGSENTSNKGSSFKDQEFWNATGIVNVTIEQKLSNNT